jgi:hypothetical protein
VWAEITTLIHLVKLSRPHGGWNIPSPREGVPLPIQLL